MAFALGLMEVVVCLAQAAAGQRSPHPGEAPPSLTLSAVIQGPAVEHISWEKLKGKVVVLEFWNTQCAPCIAAIPHWNALADAFRSKPVVFLGLSDDNQDVREHAMNKPVVDETGMTGLWDVDVKWEMSDSESSDESADPAKVIKAAREQLGLELNRTDRKLPVLVVKTRPRN